MFVCYNHQTQLLTEHICLEYRNILWLKYDDSKTMVKSFDFEEVAQRYLFCDLHW